MTLIILAVVFIIFLFVGTPVSFVIGISSMTASFVDKGIPPSAITTKLVTGIDTFPIMAGAFFILAGELMSNGSITKRLIDFSKIIIGRIRGGTAQTSVLASVFFAGISGAAVADLAAVGSILTPAMKKEGYDDTFSTSLPVAASIVGPIIPPSVIMVFYAMATNSSIGALFLAGIVPGILMGLAIMAYTMYLSIKRKYPRNDEPFPGILQFLVIFRKAILVLFMPLIIVGGVLSGVFTATESGNIAVIYALFLSLIVYREYTFKQIYRIFVGSAVTISIALLVISTASSLAWILAVEQLPQRALSIFTGITDTPLYFLILLNIVLLIVGMFLDPGAAVILLAPMLLPLGEYFMIDPLHLAIIVILNLTIGLITPPVGVCLYVGSSIGKIPIEKVVKGVLPFVFIEILVLLFITFIPQISLFLPRLFGF
ncbi:TRAP transporter large permease [Ferviditalea candida]|uniref:TRAP transporter large permease n=1 Tax=Ferviditalea candida TaxID=3108399 RepID=A0ABU5ZHZ3_9BACL|nr:TRAP transporter large permease [Paenibacillaceae bacterium T2]